MSHSAKREHRKRSISDTDRIQSLQNLIDNLLSGRLEVRKPSSQSRELFAEFLPGDKDRATGIAALCMRIADDIGGVGGLEAAVNELVEYLDRCPLGMVEYAAKIFLTHYKPARKVLQMRSLEERQPASVGSSDSPSANLAGFENSKMAS